jgi:ATP:ADP antiporter, AAA family
MICAGAVTAQFVGGKATRDALYLAQLDITSLPLMVVVTSLVSIGVVALASRYLQHLSPAIFVPVGFAVSAVLLLIEWGLTFSAPRLGAAAVYLQISGVGPMLGSGFWLILSECFDPRTAKMKFGQIAGAGTLGGLFGGLVAERMAALLSINAMLPALAIANVFCAWQIRRLAVQAFPAQPATHQSEAAGILAPNVRSGLRVLRDAPYLQNLAALVLLGTAGAALVDYIFKVQAVEAFGRGEGLLRFFAIYYAAISLVTFVIQTSASRIALEKLGLAISTSTPSLALIFTGLGGIAAPGLQSAMLTRGGESIFRGSLFRSGYELFYTPIPLAEKAAAKSIIDVGFDRIGDAVGGGLIRVLIVTVPPMQQGAAILAVAIICSIAALAVATRLNQGYIQTLERSLLNRAVELELGDVDDVTTRTVMFNTVLLGGPPMLQRPPTRVTRRAKTGPPPDGETPSPGDPDVARIAALRSRDAARVLATLGGIEKLPGALIQHVIPLLAWDAVAQEAMNSLRRIAEDRIGELTDALLDRDQPFVIRRRLARVFSVCVSQRAADGLVLALDDLRFEVRFHCARSLTSIRTKNPAIRIDKERIYEVVQREAAVGRPVWDSKRLLPQFDDAGPNMFVDDFVKERANRSLVHVFTLLALVLPAEPLQIAFRGLHTDDQNLRGTALEYLEGVLPPPIRERLWPYLEDNRKAPSTARPREQILADLLRSHQSIMLNLEELKHRQPTRS